MTNDRAEALRKALELLGANDEAAVLETLQQAADDYSAAVNVRVKDLTHKLDKIEQLSVELATALDSYDDTLVGRHRGKGGLARFALHA